MVKEKDDGPVLSNSQYYVYNKHDKYKEVDDPTRGRDKRELCYFHWKLGIHTTWCSGVLDQKKREAAVCRFAYDKRWIVAQMRRCRHEALNPEGEHIPEKVRFSESHSNPRSHKSIGTKTQA